MSIKRFFAYSLLGSAAIILGIAALLSLDDGQHAVSGAAVAIALLGMILAVAGLATHNETSTTEVTHVVEQALRNQYYSGYGDAAEDVFGRPTDES